MSNTENNLKEIPRHPAWKNALSPSGRKSRKLILADSGKTNYKILLSKNPDDREIKAANDLAEILNKISGAKFNIIKESKLFSGKKYISIGKTEISQKLKSAELGDEGYAITENNGNLYLRGGKIRGPINAVYAFLEEDLGCRWYDYRTCSLSKTEHLEVQVKSRHYVPTFELRDPYYWDAWDGNWSLRNRTNSPEARIPEKWGGNLAYPGKNFRERGASNHYECWFVHTFNRLLPPEKYFAKHPEYFSEINGERKPYQPCLSNPEVLTITIDKVKEVLSIDSGSRLIGVSLNDRNDYCGCKECVKIVRKEGGQSGILLKFVNAVADAIKPSFPDVKIMTLAYRDTAMPPKKIKPRNNVVIQLCTDEHAWRWPFLKVTETGKFRKIINAWCKIGADFYIWDYTVNYSYLPLPMPNLPVVGNNLKYYAAKGAKGVMTEGADQGYGASDARMRCWVWAKQMWNPKLDTRKLMKDFIFGYYGTAAQPVWKYNMMLWKLWEKYHSRQDYSGFRNVSLYEIRYKPDIPLFSGKFSGKAMKLFDEAEKLVVSPELHRRIQLAKLPVIYTRLCREIGVMHIAPLFWTGKDSKLRKLLKTGNADLSCYRDLIEAVAKTVKTEGIEFFTHSWFHRLPKDINHSELCLKIWREIASDHSDLNLQIFGKNWKFKIEADIAENWQSPEFDDRNWRDLVCDYAGIVKAGWTKEADLQNFSGVAWYRQNFRVPPKIKNSRHIQLALAGIKHEYEVWMNGKKAIYVSDDGEEPIVINIGKMLHPGKNLLAIRVKGKAWTAPFDQRCGLCRPLALVGSNRKYSPAVLGALIAAAYNFKK